MIKPLTIATFLMACGSGLYLYQSKHEAQVLDRTIEKTVRDTAALREQSRLLATEWTMMNDPEKLRRFSDTYLGLKAITPTQFTSLGDLDSRLPPVRLPDASPSQGNDEDAPAPVAAGSVVVPTVAMQSAPAAVVEDAAPVSRRPATPPAAPAILAAARPAERRIATSRPVVADAVPYSRMVANTDLRPQEQHMAEQRLPGPRANDPHADQHAVHPAETHVTELRTAESHPPTASLLPRPTVLAAAPRPVSAIAPLPRPAPIPFTGSLLGAARASGSLPVPRPTPVNATQWYNAN
ncbi:cell division protein FtsL [Rhodopila sp.]|uniref:cell division protein FtsL n=1 Tax=Rhodopila sp. TaxID=2480087 RepID=UPI003D10D93F